MSDSKLEVFLDQYLPHDKAALDTAVSYGQIDGSHHKSWVIDQMVRAIVGEDRYKEFVILYKDGEDGPETYTWDEGIAP
jgi:hypothetical protein